MKTLAITLCAAGVLVAFVWLARAGAGGGSAKTRDDDSATKITHANADEAAKLVAEKKVTVLDIRTAKEYAAGHIAGATQVDYYAADFKERLSRLDKSKTWLVHCAAGGRSTMALKSLKKLGFQSIVHLDGGFNAWKKAGEPVEQ
jgi:phage shock protein E